MKEEERKIVVQGNKWYKFEFALMIISLLFQVFIYLELKTLNREDAPE